MQLSEKELFELLIKRYYQRFENSHDRVENTARFAETLKEFVEKFTGNKNTISVNEKEKPVTLSSTGTITITAPEIIIKGETK